jgi:MFS family permease
MTGSDGTGTTPTAGTPARNKWTPLRNPRFRRVAIGGAVSLSCYWMAEAALAWQMRIATDADPFMVSLVTGTLQFTVMALVMPAGVIADIVDRRRLILLSHLWLATMLAIVAGLLFADLLSPMGLVALLPLIAIAQAIRMPVIGSLIFDSVERDDLAAAVALNSLGQNGSRMVGPALGGALIGLAGTLAALSAAAVVLLFAGTTLASAVPRNVHAAATLTWSRMVADARQEWTYTAQTPWKRNLLLRLALFFMCTSAVPALLPVEFNSGTTYGLMLALYGVGAFASLLVLGPPRSAAAIEKRLVAAQIIHAGGLVAIGMTSAIWIAAVALMICGGAWLAVSNGMMTAAQLQLPAQARSRGLSAVYAVGMGGLAVGGPLWGWISRHFEVGTGFVCAGVTSIALLLLTFRSSVTTELQLEPAK